VSCIWHSNEYFVNLGKPYSNSSPRRDICRQNNIQAHVSPKSSHWTYVVWRSLWSAVLFIAAKRKANITYCTLYHEVQLFPTVCFHFVVFSPLNAFPGPLTCRSVNLIFTFFVPLCWVCEKRYELPSTKVDVISFVWRHISTSKCYLQAICLEYIN